MLQRKLLIKPCFSVTKSDIKKLKQRISFAKTLFKSDERKSQKNDATQTLAKTRFRFTQT